MLAYKTTVFRMKQILLMTAVLSVGCLTNQQERQLFVEERLQKIDETFARGDNPATESTVLWQIKRQELRHEALKSVWWRHSISIDND